MPVSRATVAGFGLALLAVLMSSCVRCPDPQVGLGTGRQSRRILDITDFGAEGDGVADDSAAIQAAFDAAGERDFDYVMVYAPPGNYRLASPVAANLLTGSSHFCFSGSSASATTFTVDNPEGGFLFTFKGGWRQDRLDFTKFTMDAVNRHTGYFLRVVGPPGGGVTQKYDARLEDLVLGSRSDGTGARYGVSGADSHCIYLYALKRAIINRCTVWNVDAATLGDSAVPHSILTLENCYKPYIQNSYFNGAARIGVRLENRTGDGTIARTEGTYVQNCTINGPYTSCLVRNTGPEFWFRDNHCNFKLHGLSFVDGRKYVYILHNLMYVQGSDDTGRLTRRDVPWQPEQGVTDFYLHKVGNAVIGGNIFRTVVRSSAAHPSSLIRTHYHVEGCRYISIRDDKYAAQSARQPIYARRTEGLFVSMHDQGWKMDFSGYRCVKPEEQVQTAGNVSGRLRFDGLSKTTDIVFGK